MYSFGDTTLRTEMARWGGNKTNKEARKRNDQNFVLEGKGVEVIRGSRRESSV